MPEAAPNVTDFRDLLAQFRDHRRMWVLSDDFIAAASFIEGLNTATGGALLADFPEWLHQRHATLSPSIAWVVHVAALAVPQLRAEGRSFHDLSADESEAAVQMACSLLDEFLAERDHNFRFRAEHADV